MLSSEEFEKKCELCKAMFIKPLQLIEDIGERTEIDFVQIALTTLLGIAIGLITSGASGLGSLIGVPIGIFLGGAILLLISLIAGGHTDYVHLVNFASYLALLGVLASLFHRVPFVSRGAELLASLYGIYLVYIGLPILVEAKKEVMKIIAIVLVVFSGFGFIVHFVWKLGWAFLRFIL